MSNLREELDRFIADSGLDSETANTLYDLEPGVQRDVLARGPLTDARNPSAVVMSRVRQVKNARAGILPGAGFGGDSRHMEKEIAQFVTENRLDDRAAACLREAEANVLKELFARGPLTDARNPSAVVLSRIRECKTNLQSKGSHGSYPSYAGGYGGQDWGKGKAKGGTTGFAGVNDMSGKGHAGGYSPSYGIKGGGYDMSGKGVRYSPY
eukprot:GEMP01106331.1.p1 GENE.GEMP01106331.1~~GEMP01106331.1.p1  ORF type:complete len:210 (+),score=42.36 GEMP01106331.1:42-671(+)